jgi:hypothetical protein
MRGIHEHDCDHGHMWVCKQWDCQMPVEWNCLPHQQPQQGPKQGAERALTLETDLEAVYAVTTVVERISLTPEGERLADLILKGR